MLAILQQAVEAHKGGELQQADSSYFTMDGRSSCYVSQRSVG
jgi:hypothetical protein